MDYLNDVNYKDCVGKVCKSLNSGDFKILKYNDSYNVEIQFVNTGFETVVQLGRSKTARLKIDTYHLFMVLAYWVLNIHLRLTVFIQKSISCGQVCYRDVIPIHLKRNAKRI